MSQTKFSDQTLILTPELRQKIDSVAFCQSTDTSETATPVRGVGVSDGFVWATDMYRIALWRTPTGIGNDLFLPGDLLANLDPKVEVAVFAEYGDTWVRLSWGDGSKLHQMQTVKPLDGRRMLERERENDYRISVYREKFLHTLKGMKRSKIITLGETVLIDSEARARGYAVSPQVSFGKDFMVSALQWFDDEVLTFVYSHSHEPIAVSSGDRSMWVMPYRQDDNQMMFSDEYRKWLGEELFELVSADSEYGRVE